jgi:TonB family protein
MENRMKRYAILFLVLSLLTAAPAARLQAAAAPAQLVPAQPREQAPAIYPDRELRYGREGWVVVSYVVRTDGFVRDVVVEDSSGVPAFEAAAVLAVKRWTYTPATVGGIAVEQAFSASKINFRQSPPSDSARYPFVRAYRAAIKQIEGGNLDAAQAAIAEIEAKPTWNLYEEAWYWMLKVRYHHARGEVEPQITCLRRALAYEGTYLPKATHEQALRNLFLLEVARAEYASALETYARLPFRPDTGGAPDELATARNQVLGLVNGPDTLARPGRVQGTQSWWHRLARRDFGFDEVSGSLEQVEVRCARQVRRFEWMAGKAWRVPEEWGACTVLVRAPEGTSFRLLEYPARAAVATSP